MFMKSKEEDLQRQTRITVARYVVVDTELTGLNEKKDSIVSVGAVRMEGGRIDMGNAFYRLVKPDSSLKAESVLIHGITPSDVVQKPDMRTVLKEFLEYCGDDIIVGYFVGIDMDFLSRASKRLFGNRLANGAVDVRLIYEWLLGNDGLAGLGNGASRGYQLYDIARQLGIEVNGAHNAVIDAFITAQVFQRFIPSLYRSGIRSLDELFRLLRGGDRYLSTRCFSSL